MQHNALEKYISGLVCNIFKITSFTPSLCFWNCTLSCLSLQFAMIIWLRRMLLLRALHRNILVRRLFLPFFVSFPLALLSLLLHLLPQFPLSFFFHPGHFLFSEHHGFNFFVWFPSKANEQRAMEIFRSPFSSMIWRRFAWTNNSWSVKTIPPYPFSTINACISSWIQNIMTRRYVISYLLKIWNRLTGNINHAHNPTFVA